MATFPYGTNLFVSDHKKRSGFRGMVIQAHYFVKAHCGPAPQRETGGSEAAWRQSLGVNAI